MKYCQTITENHPVALVHPTCLEDINSHIVDEGYNGTVQVFTKHEIVIDLDKAEAFVAELENRNLNKSMDMTIGLKNDDSSIREMLLVEFKLNMDNPNNLSYDGITGKVTGSLLILGNSVPVRNEYIFVFNKDKEIEARSRLSRIKRTIPLTYITMDIDTLKATYF